MSDTVRITSTVRRELTRPKQLHEVGRPMSLRLVFWCWLGLLCACLGGLYYLGYI